MEREEREKAIADIKKFVDSGEKLEDGRVRFKQGDAITAMYSMALVILDMNKRIEMIDAQSDDYDTRNRKFASRRTEL